MFLERKQSGFSLIELLVVFMIIALVMSVVAPSINKMYSQHMAQQEMRMLQQYVKSASTKAYSLHQDIHLQLKGSKLHVLEAQNENQAEPQQSFIGDESSSEQNPVTQSTSFTYVFDYLFFQPQVIKAFRSGHIDLKLIEVRVGSAEIEKYVAVRGIVYVE